MTSFRFRLEKVLAWRRTQLDLAEAHLEQQLAALGEIDRARAELEAAGQKASVEVRGFQPLAGGDLSSLASFRLKVKKLDGDLAVKRIAIEKEVAVRQAAVVEARRRSRLLEKLKEKRHAEWQFCFDRELDELAADSYLSQWTRRRAESRAPVQLE